MAWERAITDIAGRVAPISPYMPFRLEDLDAFASRIKADRIDRSRVSEIIDADDLSQNHIRTRTGNVA